MRQWQWIMRLLFGRRKMALNVRLRRVREEDRVMRFYDKAEAKPGIEGWRYLWAARLKKAA